MITRTDHRISISFQRRRCMENTNFRLNFQFHPHGLKLAQKTAAENNGNTKRSGSGVSSAFENEAENTHYHV